MLRILLFVVATLVAISVASFTPECFKNKERFRTCCKTLPNVKITGRNHTGCYKLWKPPPSCDTAVCMAKLHGYADTQEGKINKDKLLESLQEMLVEEPELKATIVRECVNGDLSLYAPDEICDLIKYERCFMSQFAKACKEWDNSKECQETKALIKECAN